MAEKLRGKLILNDDSQLLMRQIAEGHPGALSLLMSMYDQGDDPLRELCILLDDMNMRGKQIWVAYTQCCDKNMKMFFERILERDPTIVGYVNAICVTYAGSNKAVVHGGARK